MLERLDEALDDLLQVDPAMIDDEQLTEAVTGVIRVAARLDASRAMITAEWNRRRLWAESGAKSAAAWLAAAGRIPPFTARRIVKHAHKLSTLPGTWRALSVGEITSDHAARLVAVDNPRTADTLRADEHELVGAAKSLSWHRFDARVGYWNNRTDTDGARPRTSERRRVHLSQIRGAGWSLDGWFDSIDGSMLNDELTRLEQLLFESDWAQAKRHLGREPLVFELSRTGAQRRADALVEMAKRSRTMPANGRRPKPLITIAAGYETFVHMCEVLGGTVVQPNQVAALLPDAVVERIAFGDDGRTVTASTQRTFTGALRRAIQIRDRDCYHPYCSEPAYRCQLDHIQPWSHGGRTTYSNGRLACPFHNRARQLQAVGRAETPPAAINNRAPPD